VTWRVKETLSIRQLQPETTDSRKYSQGLTN
jgi:hypothetical protein